MSTQKDIYDKRYQDGYRQSLNGYEIARCKALEHLAKKVLKVKNSAKILDYGCGTGLHIDLWRDIFPDADLHFCDISSVALDTLKQRYPEYIAQCAEIAHRGATFEDGIFDVIVSVEVMEHVENLENYLNDICRLLKPGGLFVWTTPCGNRFSIEHIYSFFTGQIEKTAEGYRRWAWEEISHLRRLKSGEIKKKLQETGFPEVSFRFRAHLFSFLCTYVLKRHITRMHGRLLPLDYTLFRRLPNGASMIGVARKKS